jgi:AcrR family transcriptional regulator
VTDLTQADKQKRERIFHATERVFGRYGYAKTTVEDVCREAGISKRTFYEQFRGKGELFMYLALHVADDAIVEWSEGLPDEITPEDKLLALTDFYANLVVTRPVIRLVYELKDSWTVLAEYLELINDSPMVKTVIEILEAGIACGQFREMEPRVVMMIIFSLLDSMYLILPKTIGMPGAAEDPVLAEETRRFIMNAVLNTSHNQGE